MPANSWRLDPADRKLFDLRDLERGLRFVWGKGGFVRGIWPQLEAFYRADFHPWAVDNRELISAWTAENQQYVAG